MLRRIKGHLSIKSFLGGKHQHFFNEVLRLLLYSTGLAEQGTPSPRRLARRDWRPPTGQEGGRGSCSVPPPPRPFPGPSRRAPSGTCADAPRTDTPRRQTGFSSWFLSHSNNRKICSKSELVEGKRYDRVTGGTGCPQFQRSPGTGLPKKPGPGRGRRRVGAAPPPVGHGGRGGTAEVPGRGPPLPQGPS